MTRHVARAYYNEWDAYAAEWLENLIAAGHLLAGDVDRRSITEVQPSDLKGYTQCHFFAGIGGWPLALRMAGWADERPVWTGSCPCQPFSVAGRGDGFADERHLWPAFFRLIEECRPATVFGEQVASKVADAWIDAVQADLEAVGYAVGAVPIPAAGVGAPHIRDRLWWVADADSQAQGGRRILRPGEGNGAGDGAARERPAGLRATGWLADAGSARLEGRDARAMGHERQAAERGGGAVRVEHAPGCGRRQDGLHSGGSGAARGERRVPEHGDAGATGRLADAAPGGRREQRHALGAGQGRHVDGGGDASGRLADAADRQLPVAGRGPEERDGPRSDGANDTGGAGWAGPLHGFWRDADWLLCRDGKWRPVEPGTFPLAHGIPARVGRLRAYGNAIVPQVAAEFIAAFLADHR